MGVTSWLLLAELGAFAGFAVGTWIADAVQRARYRRWIACVWTRDPVVNLSPPTMLNLPPDGWTQTPPEDQQRSALP